MDKTYKLTYWNFLYMNFEQSDEGRRYHRQNSKSKYITGGNKDDEVDVVGRSTIVCSMMRRDDSDLDSDSDDDSEKNDDRDG